MKKQLKILARDICRAGKEIAYDKICKEIQLGYRNNVITIVSDSSFEAIYIGNLSTSCKMGYMALYRKNTEKRNSYPNSCKIAKLLEKVVAKERLDEGEGKAAYYDWPEFGGMEHQLEYFSRVVQNLTTLQR
ncbi:hypothetical protein [Parablautia sp. Marseille-Q6255]|uniref:hypothetical protein n=1 Tax=Parablautia sp. Marseille-Q6255 TaxID=3039593 RepID=UPI0024BCD962|nr:hypothetical protein [Parablautia sp. Marseille-Q6255]